MPALGKFVFCLELSGIFSPKISLQLVETAGANPWMREQGRVGGSVQTSTIQLCRKRCRVAWGVGSYVSGLGGGARMPLRNVYSHRVRVA